MSHPNPNQDPTEPMLPEDFIVNEVDDPFDGLDDGRQRQQDEEQQFEEEVKKAAEYFKSVHADVLQTYEELMKDPNFRQEMDREMSKL